MTLQQIADYAMDYLDSKGIAAEYLLDFDILVISFIFFRIEFVAGASAEYIKRYIDSTLLRFAFNN